MIKVLLNGKTSYTTRNFSDALTFARETSKSHRDTAVYIQDGNLRTTLRNGYVL